MRIILQDYKKVEELTTACRNTQRFVKKNIYMVTLLFATLSNYYGLLPLTLNVIKST